MLVHCRAVKLTWGLAGNLGTCAVSRRRDPAGLGIAGGRLTVGAWVGQGAARALIPTWTNTHQVRVMTCRMLVSESLTCTTTDPPNEESVEKWSLS